MFGNPLTLGQDVSRKIRKPGEFEAVMANFVRDAVTNPLISELKVAQESKKHRLILKSQSKIRRGLPCPLV